MGSTRDELILALEENGYAEKEFPVITSPVFGIKELITLFTKEGVIHKIRILESDYRDIIYIHFVYLFGSGYDDAVISIERCASETASTLSKFTNALIEAIYKIEHNLAGILENYSLKLINVHSIKDREMFDHILSFRIVYTSISNNKTITNSHRYFIQFNFKKNLLKVFSDNKGIVEIVFSCEI